jgi:SAM-dependent methyltransferase
MGQRSNTQRAVDFITFPFRALALIETDRFGLSSLATERYDYCFREVIGYCLDIGCGKNNRFVNEFLNGNGRGIDIYPYDGLTEEHLVDDLTTFPFEDETFDSITFIANLNHIPESQRDQEFSEAYRVLKPGGNIIATMGNPLAEILTHKVIWFYDKVFKTNFDMDNIRGMSDEEAYYLLDPEIYERFTRAGFKRIRKKFFLTQWGLNHLFVGWKE